MGVAKMLKAPRSKGQGFVPGRLAKHMRPIGRIAVELGNHGGVFAHARFANERQGQTLRVVNVIKTKTPLDTQTVVVGWAISTVDTHNFVVFDVVG